MLKFRFVLFYSTAPAGRVSFEVEDRESEEIMPTKKRVLIADTDNDLVTRLEFFFEDKGYETTTAWNGQEALMHLRSRQFEVILLSDYFTDAKCEEIWRVIHRLPGKPTLVVIERLHSGPVSVKKLSDISGDCVVKERSAYLIFESVHECLTSRRERAVRA